MRHLIVSVTLSLGLLACADPHESSRAALRARIDWAGSVIAPQPREAEPFRDARSAGFVAPYFADRWMALTGHPLNVLSEHDSEWTAASLTQTIRVDHERATFEIRDARGYDQDDSGGEPDLAHVQLNVEMILDALGVAPKESPKQLIRGVGAAEREDSFGARTTERRVATKVFVQRSVAGLPVAGERLVLSFTNSGDFRKLLGRWHSVDYSRSRLVSGLRADEFEEAALDRLDKLGLDLDSKLPIRLGTRYAVERLADGIPVLVIQGYALVTLEGPNGSHKFGIYEFPI